MANRPRTPTRKLEGYELPMPGLNDAPMAFAMLKRAMIHNERRWVTERDSRLRRGITMATQLLDASATAVLAEQRLVFEPSADVPLRRVAS